MAYIDGAREWHAVSKEEALKLLKTDLVKGLSHDEVEERLKVYGLNEVKGKKRSPIAMLASQFAKFLVGILIIATIISALLGEVVDAIAISVVVLIMGAFGFVQEYRAEKTLELLKRMASPRCRVIRGGTEIEIEAKYFGARGRRRIEGRG